MGLVPTLPQSRPLTLEDFEAVRDVDQGHRYELIDGALIVTPSPADAVSTASVELTSPWPLRLELGGLVGG